MDNIWLQKRIGHIFLITAGVFVIFFSGLILFRNWHLHNKHLDELLLAQAEMGLEIDLAIRCYAAETIRPFVEEHVLDDQFIPKLMSSSYIARSVFEKVRVQFPECVIKFPSDNPRNPANLASPEELEMIEYFDSNPNVKKWSGHIKIDGKQYFASFTPRRVTQGCLRCHGNPEDAPASLLAEYGDKAGFDRPLGKVIALDAIAIPDDTYKRKIVMDTAKGSAIMIAGMLIFMSFIYVLLQQLIKQLSKQKSFLDNIFESLTHPFCVIDAQTFEVTMANKAAKELSDLNTNNKCFSMIWNKDSRCSGSDRQCPVKIVKETEKPVVSEYDFVDADHKPRSIEINAYPVFDEYGRVCQVIEHVIDITERKASDLRLKESEARFKHIAKAAGEWIWEIDTDGLYTYSNSSIENILGYTPEEVVGKMHFYNFFDSEVMEQLIRDIFKGIADRQPFKDHITQNISKSGQPVILRTNAFPIIDKNDNLVGYRGVHNDITEYIKALEELKKAKDDAEKANEVKSQFLANMSHEIRTPMNAIIGFSDLLSFEPLNDEQMDYVNTICSSGKHLLDIIEDILDFSRIESGNLKLLMTNCGIADLLDEIRNMLQLIVENKNLEFKVIISDDVPETIVTDPDRLRQCLINLVNNALKFTETGHVYVYVSSEMLDGRTFIRLDVEDTGIGIPADKLDTIFESFSQADDSHTRKYGGTGLGLTITKKFAELFGGTLTVQSKVGKGSTFSLVIPANTEAAITAPAQSSDTNQNID